MNIKNIVKQKKLLVFLLYFKKTNKSISAIALSCDGIATLIKNSDPNKFHGYDMVNIQMMKLCDKSICKLRLYTTVFFNILQRTIYSLKINVVLSQKIHV